MAEELTRALTLLAERGEPRGAEHVLEGAREEVAHRPPARYPGWKSGLAIAVAATAAVAILIGAIVLITWPAETDPSPVITAPVETVTTATTIPAIEPGELDEVRDLTIAPDGSLWAATAGGIVRWDLPSGTPEVFGPADGLGSGRVTAIAASPDGTVWGAGESWIARFDGTWKTWESVDLDIPLPIGDIAVGPDGALWVAAGDNALFRFDGSDWTRLSAPTAWTEPWTFSLAVAPDGTLWATLLGEAAVVAFDGEWSTYDLPGPTENVSIGADGTVWVGGDGMYGGPDGDTPPAGITRFDGTTWTTFTIADGLLSNGAGVAAGSDGTVWAIHTALPPEIADRLGVVEVEGISHFDGSTWTTHPPAGGAGSRPVVGLDGTLWMPSSSGIVGFDGSTTTRLVAGVEREPPPPPPEPAGPAITLERVDAFEPVRLSTSIGEIEFTTWRLPEGWEGLWRMTSTPHGVAGVSYPAGDLVWSIDGVTWQETPLSIEPDGIAVDGDDLIVYGQGTVRLAWDGTRWMEAESIDLDRAWRVVSGLRGIVAVDGIQVRYSTDGQRFQEAAQPPGRGELPHADGVGTCSPASYVSGIMPSMGPVVATESGFLALTPRHPSDWTTSPACEPLVWYSSDGNVWELASTESPFGEGAHVAELMTHNGLIVAAGGAGELHGLVWTSEDGTSWQRVDIGAISPRIAGGTFLTLLDQSRGDIWFSLDGSTWDGPHPRPPGWQGFAEVATSGDLIVGSGRGPDPTSPSGEWGNYLIVGELIGGG